MNYLCEGFHGIFGDVKQRSANRRSLVHRRRGIDNENKYHHVPDTTLIRGFMGLNESKLASFTRTKGYFFPIHYGALAKSCFGAQLKRLHDVSRPRDLGYTIILLCDKVP